MTRARKLAVGFLGVSFLLLVVSIAMTSAHIYFNSTISMPTGWYRAFPLEGVQPTRGELVMACMPLWAVTYRKDIHQPLPPGPCPGGASTVLKYVAGVPGDRISVQRPGVTINGVYWVNSALHDHNSQGGYIPQSFVGRTMVLKPGEYWLMTHVTEGFDSRYWGPSTQVLFHARPLFVFPRDSE